jgi:hypothetical protein
MVCVHMGLQTVTKGKPQFLEQLQIPLYLFQYRVDEDD